MEHPLAQYSDRSFCRSRLRWNLWHSHFSGYGDNVWRILWWVGRLSCWLCQRSIRRDLHTFMVLSPEKSSTSSASCWPTEYLIEHRWRFNRLCYPQRCSIRLFDQHFHVVCLLGCACLNCRAIDGVNQSTDCPLV